MAGLTLVFVILLLFSTIIMAAISLYSFSNRELPGARYFSFAMLSFAVFALGSVFELLVPDLQAKLFWRNVEQSAVSFFFPFLLLMVLDYTGKDRYLSPLKKLPFISLAWVLFLWTDNFHHLIRKDVLLVNGRLLEYKTIAGSFFNIYCFALYLIAMVIIIIFIRSANTRLRRQAILIGVALLFPAIDEIIKIINPDLGPYLIPTGVYFLFTGIIIFWSIFKYRLFSVVPIARDKVIATISEGVLMVDGSGYVIDNNVTVNQLFSDEVNKDDILGKPIGDLLSPWPDWQAACVNMNQSETEIEVVKNGKKRVYIINVYPLYSDTAVKLGTVSILLDNTENMRRQAELAATAERLEKINQYKDKLFTIVSHDIRDPLATLVNLTEILQEEKDYLSTENAEIIEEVQEQITDTYYMVENLLQWFRSKDTSIPFSPDFWELSDSVQDSISVLRNKGTAKNIDIISEITQEMTVFTDRELLDIILRNLITNAIKFTESHGSVSIDAKETAEFIIVSVKDTGVGIEPETMSRLFDENLAESKNGTDGEKGTGLGLGICKELVELCGGVIWVDSVLGKGSTFFFSIPSLPKDEDLYNKDDGRKIEV